MAKKILAILALVVTFAPAAHALLGPSNYYECILSRIPDAASDQEATSIRKTCRSDFPDFYWRRALEKQSDGLFFTTTAQECLEKKLADVTSRVARLEIVLACRALYEDPAE